MKRNLTKTALLILITAYRLAGQTNCNYDLIIGSWNYKHSTSDSDNLNKDSLIQASRQYDSTVIGTWTFSKDNKYSYQNSTKKHKSVDSFSFDEKECIIIIGKKSKSTEESTYKIKYLDNHNLILCRRNPKGAHVCYVLYKN